MELRRLTLEAYGHFRDVSVGPFDAGVLHVVLGPNESGKSTLRDAWLDLLCGFAQRRGAAHPRQPWSGETLSLSASLCAEGVTSVVRRRLDGSASSSRECDGVQSVLRGALVEAGGLSRDVVASVYAPHPDGAQDEAWTASLEDRLLGGALAPSLRPTRDVLEELRAARKALWRDDRRGRPLDARLRVEADEARGALDEAMANDRATREAQATREPLRRRLVALRHEAERLEQRTTWGARLWERAEVHRRRREWRGAVDGSRPDPGARSFQAAGRARVEERQRLERQRALVVARRDRLRAQLDAAVLDPAGDLLERLVRLLDAERARPARRLEARRAVRDVRDGEASLHRQWQAIGGTTPRPSTAALARRGSEHALKSAWRVAQAGRSDRGTRLRLAGAIVLGVLAACVFASESTWGWRLFAAVMAGVASIILLRRGQPRWTADQRAVLDEGLAGWPTPRVIFPDVFEALARVRRGAQQVEEGRRRLEALLQQHQGALREAARLQTMLDAPWPSSRSAWADHLADLVERGRARRAEIAWLRPECSVVEVEARGAGEAVVEGRSQWLRRVATWRAWCRVEESVPVHEVLAAADRLADVDDELTQREEALRPHHPQLDALEADLDDEERRALDEGRSRADEWRARRQVVTDEQADVARRLGALERDAERDGPVLSVLVARREVIAERRRAVRREHDRLWLLERLLAEGARRDRAKHRSDVLDRASGWLARWTEGRYAQLRYDGDRRVVFVEGRATAGLWRARSSLSRGTSDQVQLALRLALADHLDADRGVSLPRWFDETFVHWDDARLEAAGAAWADVAARVPMVITTCREDLAHRLERAAGARIWPLERGRAAGA